MYLSSSVPAAEPRAQRRRFPRFEVQCRARIIIGTRHYAGYLHNISRGGARLRTITPIRKLGCVLLRLPDLRPLQCQLQWTDSFHAGVSFELPLSRSELSAWARGRLAFASNTDCEIVQLSELQLLQAASPRVGWALSD